MPTNVFDVVEICAGAGGQALGLEHAGFEHRLAIELDSDACATLRMNRPGWAVVEGDAADPSVWNPADHKGVALLAGGVPCPPFTIAGKQLGAKDERDLFAWAIELTAVMEPRALMLENVRGLSAKRFAAYRQHVLDRLGELGYISEWKLLQASDYGVPQLRPRFVLVALRREYAPYFSWPEPQGITPTVGETLKDLMGANGWAGAEAWAAKADRIAPTIVGGSKKHGGADLGPSRAKAAWELMGVNGWGVGDTAPSADMSEDLLPKLTCEMVARLQGWNTDDRFQWEFTGRKTAKYRQIGNAFPPPVAAAIGQSIMRALKQEGEQRELLEATEVVHDPVYRVLRKTERFLTLQQINRETRLNLDEAALERRLSYIRQDFEVVVQQKTTGLAYRIEDFKAFLGQRDHDRHQLFETNRSTIS
ncbi:DNA cytosine methyltransferase [Actinorhabdospora filicis]|uniref:DNA (cytosine-5-)-methyltransferase n=1 Tax=Actinorhabdospora filicis TaxID=1785913 RepID=A0A9W6WD40_9ACTN|nr:DNA (cytosine-5-)-methyltransferase [Actinorhabdospora filicis]GLZ81231.1 DNA cytosine methyltransferase [Actinorhabdospora filicis]